MKTLLAVALLAGLAAVPSRAADTVVREATNTVDVAKTTSTCNLVAISNSAATEVVTSTSVGYTKIQVSNLDTAKLVYCNERSGVTSSGAQTGDLVNTRGNTGFNRTWLLAPSSKWYCINDGAASSNAIVCKWR